MKARRQTVELWYMSNEFFVGVGGVGRDSLTPRQMRVYFLSPCGCIMTLEFLIFHLFPRKRLLLYFH